VSDIVGRPWSCFPDGLQPTRRAFLRTLGAAVAAASTGIAAAVADEGAAVIAEEIPSFPADGFPAGSVRMNFNARAAGRHSARQQLGHAGLHPGLCGNGRRQPGFL